MPEHGLGAGCIQSCASLTALFTYVQPAGVLHGILQEDDRVPPACLQVFPSRCLRDAILSRAIARNSIHFVYRSHSKR